MVKKKIIHEHSHEIRVNQLYDQFEDIYCPECHDILEEGAIIEREPMTPEIICKDCLDNLDDNLEDGGKSYCLITRIEYREKQPDLNK